MILIQIDNVTELPPVPLRQFTTQAEAEATGAKRCWVYATSKGNVYNVEAK